MLTFALEMLRRLFALPLRVLPATGRARPRLASRAEIPAGDLIFRLRSWPQLPEDGRTAEVYRMLSVMSNQPVNRRWLMTRSTQPQQLDALLQRLVAEGSVEVIDPERFANGEALQG